MTLEDLEKKMEQVNHPFTKEQKDFLSIQFGSAANYHSPMLSNVLYLKTSVSEDACFILHENGNRDRTFNAEETNTLGIMVLGNDIFVSYY